MALDLPLPKKVFGHPWFNFGADKMSKSKGNVIYADELAEIFGVVTFYSFFSLQPKGKYIIGCCLGTACYVKGAQMIIDKFSEILGIQPGETTEDGLFTIDALRCIGACGIAPAVTINGKVYPKMTGDAVPAVVEEYRKLGGKEA